MSDRNLGEDNLKAESAAIVSTLFCSFLFFFCIHLFLPNFFPVTETSSFGSWITYAPCTNLRCVMNWTLKWFRERVSCGKVVESSS